MISTRRLQSKPCSPNYIHPNCSTRRNTMKTEYLFKPNNHWKSAPTELTPLNYIPENIYQELKKFYGEDMLKVEIKEEDTQ